MLGLTLNHVSKRGPKYYIDIKGLINSAGAKVKIILQRKITLNWKQSHARLSYFHKWKYIEIWDRPAMMEITHKPMMVIILSSLLPAQNRETTCRLVRCTINTSQPKQNGRHFTDGIFKRIFLIENVCSVFIIIAIISDVVTTFIIIRIVNIILIIIVVVTIVSNGIITTRFIISLVMRKNGHYLYTITSVAVKQSLMTWVTPSLESTGGPFY